MKYIFNIVLLTIYVAITHSVLFKNVKDNVYSLLKSPLFIEKKILRTAPGFTEDNEISGQNIAQTGNADEYDDKPREENVDSWQGGLSNSEPATKDINIPQEFFIRQDSPEEKFIIKRKRPNVPTASDDIKMAQKKSLIIKRQKDNFNENKINLKVLTDLKKSKDKNVNKIIYQLDPVLNLMKLRSLRRLRQADLRRADGDDSENGEDAAAFSSSLEMKDWKQEWSQFWMLKKLEALNSTGQHGDIVNLVAARPWGVPCGDPSQQDMPWGTCVLGPECEAEYRIFRGDYFCGRSEFVCCGLQFTNYDLYQGLDPSFSDKSLSTDLEERKHAGAGGDDKGNKAKNRQKKKRRDDRDKRKKKIKDNIENTIKEIKKILNKLEKNGSKNRRKKTKLLKKFVKALKKQYKNDRISVKEMHTEQMVKIDLELMKELNELKAVNHEFVDNSTFRDIVINGTITKKGARMLAEAFPQLIPKLPFISRKHAALRPNALVKLDPSRRSMDIDDFMNQFLRKSVGRKKPKYFDYDIEYGLLYY